MNWHRLPSPLSLVLAALLALAALPACGGGGQRYAVPQGEQLYTLTNMRPDGRNHIHSVMYSAPPQGALLPICTPVQLEEVTDRVITFRDLNSHRRYRYIMHRSARSGVQSHVQRYFGTGCPDISQLSPEDQAGVQQGQVYQGMSKQGVIMAIGYPPEHETPSLEGDIWRYWRNRVNSFEVYFTNGFVTGIRN
ncbi:MAG TPA: hypothetical protein RMH85_32720 [Polyangiaceae bacterium LLY-WYZ-15_(1-7)]|nr:hypothetical protein [Myxococcales bacterium]MAT28707.1 hypothetical protein [Sandaracinus sp.]HJK89264.1 hypothetical protein [Polyangiaceae bacterium LLY-WYZ-15_(1-7)]MBJ69854.1 hypothetical protein [Sandaracinus sp.]HJL02211.1 hypothetical protein [Polyangiaceae bacterium LLY-WYZ-15_(1-7)]